MNIADEGTSAHLQAKVHSKVHMASLSTSAAAKDVNTCFERWGLPKNIKIDNGRPLVNPRTRDVPTLVVLWWIGLGINVIQNRPAVPQDNGIVEGLQGILKSWVNPSIHNSIEQLQTRIDKESHFQRCIYRMPGKKKQNKTRMELHPDLEKNTRVYDPKLFSMQKVYDYLSDQVWERQVKASGDVKIWGTSIYIGKAHARWTVYVTFDPLEKQWMVRKADGKILKESKNGVPTEQEIKSLALGQ